MVLGHPVVEPGAERVVVDVFGCLRRPEEISFAGGAFVIVDAGVDAGELLASKGIPGSRDRRYIMLHNPVHLLGIEAIATVLAVADGKQMDDLAPPSQSYDLVARAHRDVGAGEVFHLGERHVVDHVDAEIQKAEPLGLDRAVPYYLLAGTRARRPIARGVIVTGDDVLLDASSALLEFRSAQDERSGRL